MTQTVVNLLNDSIFDTVKKSLGLDDTYTGFDSEIILGINTAVMVLGQLGIGPSDGLVISDNTAHWHQLTGTETNLEAVRTYVCLKTRLIFDPPSSATVLDSYNRMLDTIEWRLREQVEANKAVSSS